MSVAFLVGSRYCAGEEVEAGETGARLCDAAEAKPSQRLANHRLGDGTILIAMHVYSEGCS
jgi:hypothetical protein